MNPTDPRIGALCVLTSALTLAAVGCAFLASLGWAALCLGAAVTSFLFALALYADLEQRTDEVNR